MNVDVQGTVAPGFDKVRDAFADNWQGIEVGACLSVFLEGEKIIDLWGGYQDQACTEKWQEDTLVNVYSTTKGLASVAVARLVDQGLLDYEAPIVDYWPEFGAQGKSKLSVAQVLSHLGGVCGVDEKIDVADLYDWEKMTRLLAAQKPLWDLGTEAGYHAVTWGYLPGELFLRITGKSLGTYFRDEIAAPLGADCYIGLPKEELQRCATLIGPNRARLQPKPSHIAPIVPPLYAITMLNPSIKPYRDASSDEWRMAEIAAANGQANARGIATVYAIMANGGSMNGIDFISPEGIVKATKLEKEDGIDLVTGKPMRRARGFVLGIDGSYGPNKNAFGHAGVGGSLGFADADKKISFGYAMNQMQSDPGSTPRSRLLVDALYASL
ncbi:MAG: CubicO group peptidase (beta-lactamase class C family) [Oceanicoccus sp.]|jgi:CubicO group peptidase (beta-lactamase class C family)